VNGWDHWEIGEREAPHPTALSLLYGRNAGERLEKAQEELRKLNQRKQQEKRNG